jgi:hypothetical protein
LGFQALAAMRSGAAAFAISDARLSYVQFVSPMSAAGSVMLTAGPLSTLLERCEWRALARNLRPELAG